MHHLERTVTERPTPLGYEPALDGIRAVAVTAVVGFHAFGIPRGGFLGVDLFFVLSGFLITTILVREHAKTGEIALGRFVQRRALRLLPALLTLLALYAAAVGIKIAVTGTLGHESVEKAVFGVVAGILYFSNIVTAHHVGAMPGSLVHLWSLAAEEQFYIFWPISLLVVLRVRPRLLPWLLVTTIAAVAAHRFTLAFSGAGWSRLYFAPDTRADALLVGCLFGYWRAHRAPAIVARIAALRWTPMIAAAGIIALLALSRYQGRFVYEVGMSALLLCCGLLIFAVTVRTGGVSGRVLRLPPLVYVGRISYSAYLWHVSASDPARGRDGRTDPAPRRAARNPCGRVLIRRRGAVVSIHRDALPAPEAKAQPIVSSRRHAGANRCRGRSGSRCLRAGCAL